MSTQTLKDARKLAAHHGFALSEKEEEYIRHAQEQERARLIATTPQTKPGLASKWNAAYPKILKSIVSLGETLLTFVQTIIVSLGVPVGLALLLLVEHQRVVHGIELFETDKRLASIAAAALVLANLVLEFLIHYIEHAAGYHEEQGKRWSLWIWWQNAMYTLGIGDTWAVQYVSPAQRYKRLLKLVTFSILALALAGSMRSVIEGQSGAWYQAIVSIATDSTLFQSTQWIGGLLFAVAAVLLAQGFSRYVAIRCVEIISAMSISQTMTSDPFAADVDAAGALALETIINARLAKAEEKAAKAKKPVEAVVVPAEPRPFGATAHAQADHEFTPMIVQQPAPASSANGNGNH